MDTRKSSCVKSHAYDTKSKILTVYYTNNTSYDYEDVPLETHVGLCNAESKGQYLNLNVKGIYSYVKRPT